MPKVRKVNKTKRATEKKIIQLFFALVEIRIEMITIEESKYQPNPEIYVSLIKVKRVIKRVKISKIPILSLSFIMVTTSDKKNVRDITPKSANVDLRV